MSEPLYRSRPGGFEILPASMPEAREIRPGIYVSEGLSNSFLVTTSEGRVVINTGPLVAKNGWKSALWIIAREGKSVGMANASCLDLYQHLARLRAFQVYIHYFQGLSCPKCYRCTCFHYGSYLIRDIQILEPILISYHLKDK